MKHTLLYIATTLLLAGCGQEELPLGEQALGYLSLSAVEVEASDVQLISTRAENTEDLTLSIEETGQSYNPIPSEIALAPGEYHITISNNADPTKAAVFEMDTVITIEEEKVTNLGEVKVPMTNFGVQLKLPEVFDDESIITYTFTVNEKDLTNGQTVYFNYSSDAKIEYKLTATNADDETKTDEDTYSEPITSGTIYVITYSLATKSLQVEK